MNKPSPYSVKRKEYRLEKSDSAPVEVNFTIKGPTVCQKKFNDAASAQRECDIMNEAYNKGYEDGVRSTKKT